MTFADRHKIVARDDTEPQADDASHVLVCACGRSFIAFGHDRMAFADWQHRQHLYEASQANSANNESGRNYITRPSAPPMPLDTPSAAHIASSLRRHIRDVGPLPIEQARAVWAEALVSDVKFNRALELCTGNGYRAGGGWLVLAGTPTPDHAPTTPDRPAMHPRDRRHRELHAAGATLADIAAELTITLAAAAYEGGRLGLSHTPTNTPKTAPSRRYQAKRGRAPHPARSAVRAALRAGTPRADIAAEYGVRIAFVHQQAAALGLTKSRASVDHDHLRALIAKGHTSAEIQAIAGVSQRTAARAIAAARAAA